MKVRKITNLLKNVYLIDGKEFEYELFKHGIYTKDENGQADFIEGNFDLLGKIKDLTEEQCEPLVEGNNGEDIITMWFDYTQPKTCFFCFTKEKSTESFPSALEAEINHELFSDNSIIFVDYGS